jgi:hypothetical protein
MMDIRARRFAFKTCAQTRAFCEAIVGEMIRLFDIPEDEAVGRVNGQWQHLDLTDPLDVILHEDEVFWAKDIYFGHDSAWWNDEANAKPRPFP